MSADGLSPRDRRALQWGAVACGAVLAVALALPAVRRWADREAAIAARVGEVARLRGLAEAGDALAPALAARRELMTQLPRRPLAAATPELAAGALQALLQQYADESQLTVVQLDAAGGAAPDGDDGSPALPASLIATGDVYAVADLLSRIEQGAVLLEIRELTVQTLAGQTGASGQERLQVTLSVRAPVVTP